MTEAAQRVVVLLVLSEARGKLWQAADVPVLNFFYFNSKRGARAKSSCKSWPLGLEAPLFNGKCRWRSRLGR